MRSDAVKTGTQQAPHRSLFNALGMTKEEMERPLGQPDRNHPFRSHDASFFPGSG